MDPSLRNWGWAKATLDISTMDLTILEVGVVQTKPDASKDVQSNSKDISNGEYLLSELLPMVQWATCRFAEIPYGSQSNRGAVGNGMCFMAIAAFRVGGYPVFEITPRALKHAVHGKTTASKAEIYEAIVTEFPHLNWPTKIYAGLKSTNKGKIEHMADAVGSIKAGLVNKHFLSTLQILQNSQ